MATYQRLGAEDLYYLAMESRAMHNHVGMLSVLEDPGLSTREFRDYVESRLGAVPRFRQKLMSVPFGLGRPVWIDDGDFDIDFHVRRAAIPRGGGMADLRAMMARLQSIPLDRDRPLWELWLVDMPEDRKALLQKTHHCVADGISGIDIATVLWDSSPDGSGTPDPPDPQWRPGAAPNAPQLLADSLLDRARSSAAGVVRAVREAAVRPREAVGYVSKVEHGLLSTAAHIPATAHTSLRRRIGGHRRYETAEVSLGDVKAIKNAAGTTVNDVVLAVVAGGLRHLLLSRGDVVDGLEMHALVPVSFRTEDERMTFGNKVAAVIAALPVGEADPQARLRSVHGDMGRIKDSGGALGAEAIMRLGEFAPPTLLVLAGRVSADFAPVDVVVTNVPGPQHPLYLREGRLLKSFLCAGVSGTATLNIAALSYDGIVTFGINGDWDTVPDIATFRSGIETSLEELAA